MTAPAHQCLVCGTPPPYATEFARDGFTLVRCPSCGLVFQDPQPADEALAAAYYEDADFARALTQELRETTMRNARQKLELLRGAGVATAGLRTLDVGASSGAWLEVAAGAGMTATGVEIGEATAAGARDRGLDVRTGTLEGVRSQLGDERFDLITFWDVLEHLRDPRHELALARRLLAPGGRIAATCPNPDGLYPRLTHRLLAARTGIWEYPELPVHLYDFSPSTMARLLDGQGLSVQAARTFAIPYAFYRSTTLSPPATHGFSKRGRVTRAAFGALALVAYPLARATDRGNAQFVLAAPV